MTTPTKPKLEVIDGDFGNMLLRLKQLYAREAHLEDAELAESEALVDILKNRGDLKLTTGRLDGQPDPDDTEQGE